MTMMKKSNKKKSFVKLRHAQLQYGACEKQCTRNQHQEKEQDEHQSTVKQTSCSKDNDDMQHQNSLKMTKI